MTPSTITHSLFDKISRTSQKASEYGKAHFDYLNETARQEFQIIRSELDKWFNEYLNLHPDEAKELKNRFRSQDDEHHWAAMTELYIHHLLILNGYSTKPHPQLRDVNNRPDFLALKDNLPVFYIEVKVLFSKLITKRLDKFQAAILDSINQIESIEYLISLEFLSIDDKNPPATKKIQKNIKEKIEQLDYDMVCNDIEKNNKYPEWQWQENNWKIKFLASPVTEEARKRRTGNSKIIGAISYPAKQIKLSVNLKNAIKDKIKNYGNPDIPFIIAVNVISDDIFCDDISIMSALFGETVITITSFDDGTSKTSTGRNMDGIWVTRKKGICNTRLSGLMVLKNLTNAIINKTLPTLWHHPKAKHILDVQSLKIIHKVYNAEKSGMEEI